jgi:hypothetical protein
MNQTLYFDILNLQRLLPATASIHLDQILSLQMILQNISKKLIKFKFIILKLINQRNYLAR